MFFASGYVLIVSVLVKGFLHSFWSDFSQKKRWTTSKKERLTLRCRVLAHRPCPKIEMFCPSVLQLFYGCSKVLMTNHGMSFLFLFFLFFKPAGDPSSATLVPDLANQVWPFKSALLKTSRPGKRSWLTREDSATERHGNDRLSKKAVHTMR